MCVYDWLRIGAAVLMVAAYVIKYRSNVLNKIKASLLELTTQAEMAYGGELGAVKRAKVIDMIINSPFYVKLPFYVKYIISADTIGKLIDWFVETTFKSLKQKDAFKRILTPEITSDPEAEVDA